MLLGLVYATSGEIEVLGQPVPARSAQVLPQIGSLIEGPAFHPALSGRRNLEVLASLGGFPRARVAETLAIVGLDAQ